MTENIELQELREVESGSFKTSGYQGRVLTFNWSVSSRNIEENYTDINWNITGSDGDSNTFYYAGNFKVIIEGEQVYYSATRIKLWNNTVVASGTKRIYHNNDGSKSFSAYVEASIYSYNVNATGTESFELKSIPRQADMTSANDFNDEQNPYFTFENKGGLTINARIEFAGTNIQRNDIPNTGGYTFELTSSERDLLRSKCISNSLGVRYTIATKVNDTETYWSFLDKTMTIVNANPTFNNFTYQDTNTDVVNLTGDNQVLVKGLSNLQATISSANKMVANKKSSPNKYIATIDAINVSSEYKAEDLTINLGSINNAGTQRLNIRAYDSRNNSSLVYKDIVVYDYDKPVINGTVTRLNNFENQTTLSISGTYSKLTINNVDKNIVSKIEYRYRETNGEWNDWETLTSVIENGKFSCDDIILSLDNTKSFDFEIKAIDNLKTSVLSLTLDIGQAIFFISSNKKTCYINGQEILTYDIIEEF